MQPLLGIELDDASHQQAARQERDDFVERVFSTAGLRLFRQPVQHTYNVRELSTALKQQLEPDGRETDPLPPPKAKAEPQAKIINAEAEKPVSAAATPPTPVDNVPLCPKCNRPMVLRTVTKSGPHYGQQFWGCQDFPKCRGVRSYE